MSDEVKPVDAEKKNVPLPPFGGDRAAWIRWAILVALMLGSQWLSGSKVEQIEKGVQEVKQQVAK